MEQDSRAIAGNPASGIPSCEAHSSNVDVVSRRPCARSKPCPWPRKSKHDTRHLCALDSRATMLRSGKECGESGVDPNRSVTLAYRARTQWSPKFQKPHPFYRRTTEMGFQSVFDLLRDRQAATFYYRYDSGIAFSPRVLQHLLKRAWSGHSCRAGLASENPANSAMPSHAIA